MKTSEMECSEVGIRSSMSEKIILPGTDGYYRIENKVYNNRNQELIPDKHGRYKLKIYNKHYLRYRPPGNINNPIREDISKLEPLPFFSSYYYKRGEEQIYNKHGKLLKPDKNNSYYLKNDEGEWRRIKLKKILK